jgi:hypothetical protein
MFCQTVHENSFSSIEKAARGVKAKKQFSLVEQSRAK